MFEQSAFHQLFTIILLALLCVGAYLAVRYLKKGSAISNSSKVLRIIDRQYIGNGKAIISFLVGNTLVVSAITEHGAAKLLEKELSNEELMALCPEAKGKEQGNAKGFREIINSLIGNSQTKDVEGDKNND